MQVAGACQPLIESQSAFVSPASGDHRDHLNEIILDKILPRRQTF
jgi:hypothetical protein